MDEYKGFCYLPVTSTMKKKKTKNRYCLRMGWGSLLELEIPKY